MFLVLSMSAWKSRSNSLRLAQTGERSLCTVVSKRRSTGRSSRYYLTIRCDQYPSLPAYHRQVARDDWIQAGPGTKSVYYSDPGKPGAGIADLERAYREQLSPVIACAVFFAGTVALVLTMLWKLAGQMRLLRIGIEVVEPRSAFRGGFLSWQLALVSRPRSFLPARWDILVQSPSGQPGRVVLRAPDGSSRFYPSLSDVPVEKLTGYERPSSFLGRPPRPRNPIWEDWSARRCRASQVTVLFLTGLAGLAAALSLVVGYTGGWWALVGIVLAADLGFLLDWIRAAARHRALWRDGFEILAVLLHVERQRGSRGYRVGYDYHGHEFEPVGWLPLRLAPAILESPPDAPAVTKRVLILIDPHHPHRWSLLPPGLGGGL